MATFDTTDISYNVAWDQAPWWRKVKKNSASEVSRSARFACQILERSCKSRFNGRMFVARFTSFPAVTP